MKLLKTSSVFLLVILLISCNNTVKGQVPKTVKTAFKNKYPSEKNPNWEKDSHGNFEAHFKKDGKKYRADFSPKGNWIETELSIKKENLPKAIKQVISSKFKDEDITEVEYVQSATKGTFYDVEFKQKGKNKDVEFRENGQIIN